MLSSHPTLRLCDIIKKRTKTKKSLLKNSQIYYTYNARAAIYQLLHSLPNKMGDIVLAPAFHCPTIIEAITAAHYKILFYKINHDFSINYQDLYKKLSKDIAAIIVINYFGFPVDIRGALEHRKLHNYYVIEDWAHSFLSSAPTRLSGDTGDMTIYSFYKLAPSFTGGGLRINTKGYLHNFSQQTITLRQRLIIFKRLIEQMIDNLDESNVKKVCQYLEKKRVEIKTNKEYLRDQSATSADSSYLFSKKLASANMPWLSKAILFTSNFESIIISRRKNYYLVNEQIKENRYIKKIFRELPIDVCPWAYPMLLMDRENHDYHLRAMNIPVFTFGEVLHPLIYQSDKNMINDAEFFSKNLIMLPVHQGLSHNEIINYCQKINSYFHQKQKKNI